MYRINSFIRNRQLISNGIFRYGVATKRYKCVKSECQQGEPSLECESLVKCGPCSKHKYMDIRCKVAIVTGGACGIGFYTANELLCQEAYRVIIADNNKKNATKAVELLENVHGKNRACFFPLDVNNPKAFSEVFKMAEKKYGGVDILINNAGTVKDLKWELAIDTNVKSVMRGILLGFDCMQKQKKTMHGGIVVNISSTCGLDPNASAPLLSCSKHGVVGLTRCLGSPVHFQSTGVRVVGVCPGPTKTSEPEQDKDISPELMKYYFDPAIIKQSPKKVAKAINYVIRYGPTGSVWIVEDSKLFKTAIPDRKRYSKVIDYV